MAWAVEKANVKSLFGACALSVVHDNQFSLLISVCFLTRCEQKTVQLHTRSRARYILAGLEPGSSKVVAVWWCRCGGESSDAPCQCQPVTLVRVWMLVYYCEWPFRETGHRRQKAAQNFRLDTTEGRHGGHVQPEDSIRIHQQPLAGTRTPARWQENPVRASVARRGRQGSHHGPDHQFGARLDIETRRRLHSLPIPRTPS